MPSVSEKQKKFMQAAAHNATFAQKAGIKQSVAKEFNNADKKKSAKKTKMQKMYPSLEDDDTDIADEDNE